jgi:hypothetical protein
VYANGQERIVESINSDLLIVQGDGTENMKGSAGFKISITAPESLSSLNLSIISKIIHPYRQAVPRY